MKPDKIKAKIIELCPDVMELKFGSKVRFIHSDDEELPTFKWLVLRIATETPHVIEVVDNLGRTVRVSTLSKDFTFLGSPITLAVVLRAIQAVVHVGLYAVGETGHFYLDEIDGEGYDNKNIRWNLEHDNYDQQSEETKRFIGNLLGV